MSEDTLLDSVITSFNSTEDKLRDVLETVPFVAEHKDVWSPKLATVLIESCSQLDSLWKYAASLSPCVSKKEQREIRIDNYFAYFGKSLARKWALFQNERLFAFNAWRNLSDEQFEQGNYRDNSLPWWKMYNALKHNRIQNLRDAKLESAVQSLCGLFLAILDLECCRPAVAASGWLVSDSYNPVVNLDDFYNKPPDNCTLAETRLFSYPAGYWKIEIRKTHLWAGPRSARFKTWFANQDDASDGEPE